jgi:predicted nucleic acid-binding protein
MILIDTAPLVALVDARDQHHARALRDLTRMARHALATCDAVLTESCFHLPYGAQRNRLRALLDAMEVAILPDGDRRFRDDVFDWLVKYADHQPDWADGCLAVLAGRDRKATVWTYDAEFRTTWRRPDGTKIPLSAR